MDEQTALEWHNVARLDEILDDEPRGVRIGDRLIALYKVGGEVYATDDVCTHEFAQLSDGFIEGDEIECPLHQAHFNILTGKATAAPATEDIATFPVRVEGDEVLVGVPKP